MLDGSVSPNEAVVVIGLLGPDPRRRPGRERAGSGGARRSRSASTRTSLVGPARAPAPARASAPRRRRGRQDIRDVLARRRRCASAIWRFAIPGTSRRSTRAARLRPRLPVPAGRRGLPRPHHDRHPRRADLPVPAHRVAPLPRPAAADVAAAAAPRRGGPGSYCDHRSRPVEVRPDRLALRRQQPRGPVVPQVRHRHAERRVQPADRADRAGRRSRPARPCCSRARPAPASRSSRAGSTS